MDKLILILVSFFLGAIPFGYIAAKYIKGIDIRVYGSGNIGATNVFRVLGPKWGILVFTFDFLKGFTVPFLTFNFLGKEVWPWLFVLTGLAAILGHTYTPFLKFKGGKGVATSLGVFVALAFPFTGLWWILLSVLLSWLVVFFLSRMVSLASLFAGFVFLLLSLFFAQQFQVKLLAGMLFFIILISHRKNIKRIIKGKENKFK